MLNKCTEKGQSKCSQYWPEFGQQPMRYNHFVVENLDCQDEGAYKLNRIKLENTQVCERSFFHTCVCVYIYGGGGGEVGGIYHLNLM